MALQNNIFSQFLNGDKADRRWLNDCLVTKKKKTFLGLKENFIKLHLELL